MALTLRRMHVAVRLIHCNIQARLSRMYLHAHLICALALQALDFFYTDAVTLTNDNVLPLLALARQVRG